MREYHMAALYQQPAMDCNLFYVITGHFYDDWDFSPLWRDNLNRTATEERASVKKGWPAALFIPSYLSENCPDGDDQHLGSTMHNIDRHPSPPLHMYFWPSTYIQSPPSWPDTSDLFARQPTHISSGSRQSGTDDYVSQNQSWLLPRDSGWS